MTFLNSTVAGASLSGWAVHAKAKEDFLGPYLRNCIDVLDHLIAEGVTDAQQVAVQLRQFGAEVFTINLVGRASVRDLGLLMTAIMVVVRVRPPRHAEGGLG